MNTATRKDLDVIHNVTANYFFWQGLRWVPMGFALLIVALSYATWWPITGPWKEGFMFLVLIAAVLVSNTIGSYYARSFGDVRGIPGMHARRETLKWLLFYPMMGFSLIVDGVFKPPVFVSGPVWAAGLLGYWFSTGRGRPHYLFAAAVFVVLTFFPTLGLVAPGPDMLQVFLIVLGVIFIVGGILDHFELTRLLRPRSEEDDE